MLLQDHIQLMSPSLKWEKGAITGPFIEASQSLWTPLTHQVVIEVKGPDAKKFLQGQLSCDLDHVIKKGHLLGAHCNLKGQVLSLFRVMSVSQDCFWLTTHQELAGKALQQLKKYSIFSNVKIDLREDVMGLGFWQSCELLTKVKDKQTLVISISANRWELWLSEIHLNKTWLQNLSSSQAAPLQQWFHQEIHEGIPDLHPATSEVYLPQMINLQVFAGVSFKKGCYTGQEIVTRLQHRGVLKRCLYLAHVRHDQAPEPGCSLTTSDLRPVAEVIRSSATHDPNLVCLLLVGNKALVDKESLFLHETLLVELLELPYELDPRLFQSKR